MSQQKVAIVTGGAIRVGRAIALELAKHGYAIALHYNHSAESAEQTAKEIEALGVQVKLIAANLSEPDSCSDVVAQAAELGELSVLINSAAIFPENDTINDDLSHWDQVMSLNLRAPVLLSQAFAASKPQQAHIINILDARINHPAGDHLVYRLSKAGLWHLTESLARELAPTIQVNGLALGAILPPPGADADHFARMADHIPLKRTGNPQAIADAVSFLIGQSFITGTIIPVDGGEFL
ncbi:short-chain dehydrogenase [Kangiella profundi]|uniref:Short-chain dehydrogenase n=1 Tax=Kangiella profundi TaxID=1561924 RepID=A0A2K9AWS6_9GAMM|nr:SDR family oxidoreductase [Kangiella profundi]AUD79581.1 short-chain dehydrogenase [Kangiella profundi]MBD3666722.1 SDR family oxidoreductase [Kangiella sp.]GGE97221.1 short chain dehydrogenase [Kangiella profundi]